MAHSSPVHTDKSFSWILSSVAKIHFMNHSTHTKAEDFVQSEYDAGGLQMRGFPKTHNHTPVLSQDKFLFRNSVTKYDTHRTTFIRLQCFFFSCFIIFSPRLFPVTSFYCGRKMLFLWRQTNSLDSPLIALFPFFIFKSHLLLGDLP